MSPESEEAKPETVTLLHRNGREPWKAVSGNVTFAEAVALIGGGGDWWIRDNTTAMKATA